MLKKKKKLQLVQNAIARTYYTSSSIITLAICNIEDWFLNSFTFYKGLNGLAPSYLSNCLSEYGSNCSLGRLVLACSMYQKWITKSMVKQLSVNNAPKVWHKLPYIRLSCHVTVCLCRSEHCISTRVWTKTFALWPYEVVSVWSQTHSVCGGNVIRCWSVPTTRCTVQAWAKRLT